MLPNDSETPVLRNFTVLAADADEGTLQLYQVRATDGLHAFGVVAAQQEGQRSLYFLVALMGVHEEDDMLVLPGEGIVCCETVRQQKGVFGPSVQ